jgi:hypothetical protein
MKFCSWFIQLVNLSTLDPQLLLFTDEARSHLNERVNSHSKHYWPLKTSAFMERHFMTRKLLFGVELLFYYGYTYK